MASHKNHQDPVYKHLREVVLWLHDYKCYVSGVYRNDLEVHHIDKISTNHNILNMIPVTPEIHVYLGKTAKLKQLTKADILKLLMAKIKKYYS